MPNQKISELSAITVIDDADVLPIVDSIAIETKKISVTQIKGLAPVQSVNGSTGTVSVQPTLVSGTNIKTINSTTVLGSGDIAVQETLVSGTNIKTINSNSLLGSGDIVINGGSPSGVSGAIQFSDGSAFASDAANLFWDDTNNRLGIGTNAPTSALEVASDVKINGLTVGLGGGASSGCTAFGESALLDNLTGTNNTAIGKSSLENNTASNNTAVGFESALTNTSGTGVTAIGYQALRLSTGVDNTAVGYQAGANMTTGTQNTALGAFSLSAVSGARNTAIGWSALGANTGSFNTAVGRQALSNNTSAGSNSALGEGCQSGNFSGSVILGKDATATAANQFVVGSSGTNAGAVTTEIITADTTWTVRINGANYKIPMLAL